MQTTQPLYRLDYHGDDVPEYLSQAVAELTLECSYHTAAVVPTPTCQYRVRHLPIRSLV